MSARSMMHIRGDDVPNRLSKILHIIKKNDWMIEAAWLRSFGYHNGAVLLMVQSGKATSNRQLYEKVGDASNRINSLNQFSNGEAVMQAVPLFIDEGYEPRWSKKRAHLIFTIRHPVRDGEEGFKQAQRFCNMFQGAAFDIAQHDSHLTRCGNYYVRTFRVYSPKAGTGTQQTREDLRNYVLKRYTNAFEHGNRDETGISWKIPHARDIALLQRAPAPGNAQLYYYINACLPDHEGLFIKLFQEISEGNGGGVITRSCSRSLGKIGVFRFAIPATADEVACEEARTSRTIALQNNLQCFLENIGQNGVNCSYINVRYEATSPHEFTGGPYSDALVCHPSLAADAKGTLLHIIENIGSVKKTSNIYLLDAQPRPSEPGRFGIRVGSLYLNSVDAQQAGVNVVSKLLGSADWHCDAIKLNHISLQ